MEETLTRIETFIGEHHVLMLATSNDNTPQASSLFYVYDVQETHFVVASDAATEHMQNVADNPQVAAAIALESKMVGTLRGVQIKGMMRLATLVEGNVYFKAFPYAKVMNPTLWILKPLEMKLTDNRLGFGKKLTWQRESSE